MLSPDNGCPECGTISTKHSAECRHVPRKPAAPARPVHPHRGDALIQRGDECGVCEAMTGDSWCRYGECPDCGGHSEHNFGCPRIPV